MNLQSTILRCFDLPETLSVQTDPVENFTTCVSLSPCGRFVAIGIDAGMVLVRELLSKSILRTLRSKVQKNVEKKQTVNAGYSDFSFGSRLDSQFAVVKNSDTELIEVISACWSEDGKLIAAVMRLEKECWIYVWKVEEESYLFVEKVQLNVVDISFCNLRGDLVVLFADGSALWKSFALNESKAILFPTLENDMSANSLKNKEIFLSLAIWASEIWFGTSKGNIFVFSLQRLMFTSSFKCLSNNSKILQLVFLSNYSRFLVRAADRYLRIFETQTYIISFSFCQSQGLAVSRVFGYY